MGAHTSLELSVWNAGDAEATRSTRLSEADRRIHGFSKPRPSSVRCKWNHEVELSCIQKAYQSSRSQSKLAVHLPRKAGDEGTVEMTFLFGS